MPRPSSLFAGLIGRRRPVPVTVSIAVLLVLLPTVAAYLDGVVGGFFSQGYWHLWLLAPAVITYILTMSPIIAQGDADAVDAFRPLVKCDDGDLDRLVSEASHVSPAGEIIALSIGAALGTWVGYSWVAKTNWVWLKRYLPVSASLMIGILSWAIYAALAGTRLSAKLHRQPLCIDIFDITPFEPIGRQSLLSAMTFVGGIVLSMVFGRPEGSHAWQGWLVIAFLMLVPVLIFFLGMRDTHRILVSEKRRELDTVRWHIVQASRALIERIAAHQDTGSLGAEISALAVYESRLVEAKTWPYDTRMLRTLFFSVVLPAGATLAQAAFESLF